MMSFCFFVRARMSSITFCSSAPIIRSFSRSFTSTLPAGDGRVYPNGFCPIRWITGELPVSVARMSGRCIPGPPIFPCNGNPIAGLYASGAVLLPCAFTAAPAVIDPPNLACTGTAGRYAAGAPILPCTGARPGRYTAGAPSFASVGRYAIDAPPSFVEPFPLAASCSLVPEIFTFTSPSAASSITVACNRQADCIRDLSNLFGATI